MGQYGVEPGMQAEANAGNTSGSHDESPHGGGRRPPTSFGLLVFEAFASACSFCFGPILQTLLWPPIVSDSGLGV